MVGRSDETMVGRSDETMVGRTMVGRSTTMSRLIIIIITTSSSSSSQPEPFVVHGVTHIARCRMAFAHAQHDDAYDDDDIERLE